MNLSRGCGPQEFIASVRTRIHITHDLCVDVGCALSSEFWSHYMPGNIAHLIQRPSHPVLWAISSRIRRTEANLYQLRYLIRVQLKTIPLGDGHLPNKFVKWGLRETSVA